MSEKIKNKIIDFNIIPDKDNIKTKSQKILSTIDYNYPSLNRKDLSDLSNINDKNHQFKKLIFYYFLILIYINNNYYSIIFF